jgi:hypothetical protein
MRRKLRFIPATVLAVLAAGSLIAQVSGIEQRILRVLLSLPGKGSASVQEGALDMDRDGRADTWQIVVTQSQRYDSAFSLSDRNGNGIPDVLASGTMHRIVCAVYDDDQDEDGCFDRLTVGIFDNSDHSLRYIYTDLDLDGKLDMMHVEHGDRTLPGYVFMSETLARVLPLRTYDWREAWIEGADGRQVKVVFEKGEWRVVR